MHKVTKAALKAAVAGGTNMDTDTKVDVNKLKDMTRRAIEAGQAEARRLAEQVAEKERLKKLQDELKAKRIIQQIPGRAEKEAAAGRNHAIVMAVKYEDYTRPHDGEGKNWTVCKPEWLKGAVKLVFDYCVDAGLKPTLEDWHDGCGVNGGHNIVIHW